MNDLYVFFVIYHPIKKQKKFNTSLRWGVAGADLLRWPKMQAKSLLDARDKSLLLTKREYLNKSDML